MATFKYIIRLHETVLDDDLNVIKYHDTDLPHKDLIVKTLCNAWNKDHDKFMLKLINKEAADNRVSSAYMTKRRSDGTGEVCIAINFVAKSGKSLTSKIKDAIIDFMDGQYSDGWFEAKLGYNNIIKSDDGTRFVIE